MSDNRGAGAGPAAAAAAAAAGQQRRPLVWLAALGAACAVAGPVLLSPFGKVFLQSESSSDKVRADMCSVRTDLCLHSRQFH